MSMDVLATMPGRLALGLGVSILASWVCIRWLGPMGFMDLPCGRKQHEGPIPRTGGVAFIATMLLGLSAGWCRLPFSFTQWVGVLVMAVVGLLDDRLCLRARWKALVGLGVALLLAYEGARHLVDTHAHIQVFWIELPRAGWAYFILLTFFYWCVPQSFNLVDGMNGLAMGYALIVLGFLGLSGHIHPYSLGAVTGLLMFNWPRARHFLGDAGSMSLGIVLALVVKKSYALVEPGLLLWIFAYPFVDTTMVVVTRLARGIHPAHADRSHLHHLLQDRVAIPKGWVTPFLLLQAAACAAATVVHGWWWTIPAIGVTSLIVEAVILGTLEVRAHRRASLLLFPGGEARRHTRDFLAG